MVTNTCGVLPLQVSLAVSTNQSRHDKGPSVTMLASLQHRDTVGKHKSDCCMLGPKHNHAPYKPSLTYYTVHLTTTWEAFTQ